MKDWQLGVLNIKIQKIEIENYKSLRNLTLEQIGDLVILIGANNSGKTSLLELLNRFFTEIDITGLPSGIDNYCWFDGDTENDIRIAVTLEFNEEELKEIIPENLLAFTENKIEPAKRRIMNVTRKIVKPPTGWQPQYMAWADLPIMKEGKIVTPTEFLSIPLSLKAVLFTSGASKENLTGDRIILIDPIKRAYLMGTYADELAKTGKANVVNVSEKTSDWRKYASDQRYELIEKELTEAEMKSFQPITQQNLQTLATSIITRLKGLFRLILSVRDAWPQSPLMRATYIDAETQNLLRTLGISDAVKERRRWHEIKRMFENSLKAVLDIHPSYLATEEGDLRIPIQHTGGGSQEFLILMRHLTEGNFIFGVEEPELHMHPQLARGLFDIFKEASKEKQVFLSTHSTIFVDQAELENTWIVRKEGKETKIERVKSSEDLRGILFDLGVRPSDIFFSNGIVFVEGPSDRDVYSILAKKLGIDFRKMEISIIPTYGKSSGKYHLQVWIDAAKSANIPYFMVLDKGAEKEAKKFVANNILVPEQNLFILKRGSLEAYYTPSKFLDGFRKAYTVEFNETEQEIIKSCDPQKIEELLRSRDKDPDGWKVLVGRLVAESMEANEIDDEIKRILERLRTQLTLPQ